MNTRGRIVIPSNRRRPLKAARAMLDLMNNPHETGHVFRIIEALEGDTLARNISRFERTSVGRRVLHDGESILDLLSDRDYLQSLPDGTLGRAYLDFIDREGITADGLIEASHARSFSDDPHEMRARAWLRDTHDLWHTALGFHGDLLGEAAMLGFAWAQTRNLGVLVIALGGWGQMLRFGLRDEAAPVMRSGFMRGFNAEWLIGYDWFEALEKPIEQVRRELRAGVIVEYEPVRTAPGIGDREGRVEAEAEHQARAAA